MSDPQFPTKSDAEITKLAQAFRKKRVDLDALMSAAEALGKIGPPAVPHLIAALEDKDPRVRCAAVEQLGVIADQPSLDRIFEAVQNRNEDFQIRSASIMVLGNIAAISNPSDPSNSGPSNPLDLLTGRAILALTAVMKDKEEKEEDGLRDAAGYALGEIGLPAFPFLVEILVSEEEDCCSRSIAARALGESKSLDAVPFLAQVIDEVSEVYGEEVDEQGCGIFGSAISALELIGSTDAVAVLARTLEHKNLEVRFSATQRLFSFGTTSIYNGSVADPVIVAAFARRLADEAEHVFIRDLAGQALQQLGEPGLSALKEVAESLLRKAMESVN